MKNLFKKATAITLCLTTTMLIGSPAYAADDTQDDSFLSDIKNSITDFLPDEYDLSDFDLSNFSFDNFDFDNFSLDSVLNSTPSDAIPEIPLDEIIATPSDALPATPSDADDGWDDEFEEYEPTYAELVKSVALTGADIMSTGVATLLIILMIPYVGVASPFVPIVGLLSTFIGLLCIVGSPIIALFAA